MRKIILCVVATMLAATTFAQTGHNRQQRRREFNPEEMAQQQTMALHQALQLDSVQLQAVFLINYADALTMQDSINARRERMEKMKAEGKRPERKRPTDEEIKTREEINKERENIRNEQMKTILTPEQYEKYLKYKEEERERMRQGWGGRRNGRPEGAPRGR